MYLIYINLIIKDLNIFEQVSKRSAVYPDLRFSPCKSQCVHLICSCKDGDYRQTYCTVYNHTVCTVPKRMKG